jgi:type I restriction enzyme S subunit
MAALVPPATTMCLGQRMMAFRAAKFVDPEFLMWALNSELCYSQVIQDTIGATSPRVNIPTVVNLILPSPPPGEQEQIGKWIGRATRQADASIDKIGRSVDGLREYRQALITAAVTGKLDVQRAEQHTDRVLGKGGESA